MIKMAKRLIIVSSSLATVGCLSLSGIASATSINNTGPGSFNLISSSNNNRFSFSGSFVTERNDRRQDNDREHESRLISKNDDRDFRNVKFVRSISCDPMIWHQNVKSQGFMDWWMKHCSANIHCNIDAIARGNDVPRVSFTAHATISDTGPDSTNIIRAGSGNSFRSTNNNNVSLINRSSQSARSGNATVSDNTFGGSAVSGNASNNNSTSTNVQISNPSNSLDNNRSFGNDNGSINNTGPDSRNEVHSFSRDGSSMTNNNRVNVSNSNFQMASSGSARVSHNTFGGDAVSGSASNWNSTSTNVDISN